MRLLKKHLAGLIKADKIKSFDIKKNFSSDSPHPYSVTVTVKTKSETDRTFSSKLTKGKYTKQSEFLIKLIDNKVYKDLNGLP